eukprot:m.244642 g.244642  ORF g.244642 m.244642 type:complete len:336 (-) comp33833_c2_seq1:64-1071(-)
MYLLLISIVLATTTALTDGQDVGAPSSPTRILFVGNSFTFVNDLPHQLVNIATSLGDNVEVANSTIGGCTLYAQTAENDARTATLLQQDWDFIVLQDYSALPTVQKARETYLNPAVKSFAQKKKAAKVVMYLTWGYHDGVPDCPTSATAKCFPKGTLANLTQPSCATSPHYHQIAGNFSCMGYALARAYLATQVLDGADMVVPCGLAWQVVRGVASIPTECKQLIDSQYTSPMSLALPFKVPGGSLPNQMLYRVFGGKDIDKHPNVAGQYLNALTFYTALFSKSPVGAARPLNTGSSSAGDEPLNATQILALQKAAEGTVRQCGSTCGLTITTSV